LISDLPSFGLGDSDEFGKKQVERLAVFWGLGQPTYLRTSLCPAVHIESGHNDAEAAAEADTRKPASAGLPREVKLDPPLRCLD
jgi:hypothetical protein